MNRTSTKKIAMLAVIAALALVAAMTIKIPVVLFLSYEPKDVFITLGGFMFGPIASLAVSVVVSFVEMVSVSETGWIGCLMNIISSCAFACTASFIYKKMHSMKGAILGLVTGTVLTTALMLLWNYLVTPIYMGYPREAVADMLLPVFMPYNLVKYSLNSALILLVYKPIVTALRAAKLLPESTGSGQGGKKASLWAAVIALFVIATCVLAVLSFQNII